MTEYAKIYLKDPDLKHAAIALTVNCYDAYFGCVPGKGIGIHAVRSIAMVTKMWYDCEGTLLFTPNSTKRIHQYGVLDSDIPARINKSTKIMVILDATIFHLQEE
jgi:hypothetical protein